MKIMIVGGGRIGRHLAQRFSRQKHEVVLIEPDRRLCLELADSLPVAIVCGDGTEIPTLESAGVRDAGCLIAVTGTDQVNLWRPSWPNAGTASKRLSPGSTTPAIWRRSALWAWISR